MKVMGMKVSWMIGWSNLPSLNMLIDEKLEYPRDGWRKIPVTGGSYYLNRQEPAVRFFFESDHGGGALGGKMILEDGTEVITKGGWSSNAGQVNRLRALDERFAEYLPYDVVGITYYGEYARPDTYNDGWGLGMAGLTFDLPWVEEQMKEHLAGVELYDLTNRDPSGPDENQASADQAMIIGGGGGYGYIPVVIGGEKTKEGIRPSPDSELFLRTAMQYDRQDARRRKELAEKAEAKRQKTSTA